MKKIVFMAILYALFSFNTLYPELNKDEKEFVSYIANSDREEVLYFLNNKKANVNLDIIDGITPLMLSIIYKQYEIAEILIEKGANVNIKDNAGFTALIHTIQREKTDLSKMLIEKKSDVNTKVSFNTNGLYLKDFTPLTFNVDTEVAELLIKAGADLNAKDKDGNTALYYAITKNNSKIMKLISEKGGSF